MKHIFFALMLLSSSLLFAQESVSDNEIIQKIRKIVELNFKKEGLDVEYKFIVQDLFNNDFTALYKVISKNPSNNYSIGIGITEKDGNYKIEQMLTNTLIVCPINMVPGFFVKYKIKDAPDYSKYETEYDYVFLELEFSRGYTKDLEYQRLEKMHLLNRAKKIGFKFYDQGIVELKEDYNMEEANASFFP